MLEVTRLTLIKSFFRLFLLQASWNFERMQNVGVLFVVEPVLRVLYREKDLQQACQRHLSYFNTHPYMASPVLGATVALEQMRANGQEGTFSVDDFKRISMAPYAAIGDAFFWGGVRPLAACLAIFFASRESLWAPFVFLLLFNLPHLWTRLFGFIHGYQRGVSIVELIQRYRLPDVAIRLKEAMVVLLGGLSAYLVVGVCRFEQVPTPWAFVALPLVFLLVFLARKGTSALFLLSTVIVLIITLFQVVKW
ncbi:MAG: PTS system mannose/fructose/sorbose family transporter subunit IID [Desulfuromonadales bacterium]|nr:PTS system mannose/fructose/sorbose family transporter subunit IID [Desulfuromonadales bacterium]